MKKRIAWQLSAPPSVESAHLYEVESGMVIADVTIIGGLAFPKIWTDYAEAVLQCSRRYVNTPVFCGEGAKAKAMGWLVSQFAEVAEEVIAPNPAPEVVE